MTETEKRTKAISLNKGIKLIKALKGLSLDGPGFTSINQAVLGICCYCEPGITSNEALKIVPVSRRCLHSIIKNMVARGVMTKIQVEHPTLQGRFLIRLYLTPRGMMRIENLTKTIK